MNFSESTFSPVPREFLAIVLAGFGNEFSELVLSPLTNDHGDEPCPKALLPIANKPMISYVLQWIEESGLKDAMIICPGLHKMNILNFLSSEELNTSLDITLEAYDGNVPTTGSMEVLSKVAARCQSDFVILPCDFFPPPSFQLNSLLNDFRVATDVMVMNSVFYEVDAPSNSSDDLPGPSAPPLVVYDEKAESLLHVEYSEGNEDDIALRMSLAWKSVFLFIELPRFRFQLFVQISANEAVTRLVDSHVYVCKRGVLDLIADRSSTFESFREDFLPWLCKLQYQSGRRERHKKGDCSCGKWRSSMKHNTPTVLTPILHQPHDALALAHSTTHLWSKAMQAKLEAWQAKQENASPKILFPKSDDLDLTMKEAEMRVGFVIKRLEEGPTLRANNLLNYMELNRRILAQMERQPPPKEGIDPKAVISPDSLVGESTRVGEKAVIKKSVVGQHCIIGKYVRMTGSVIGDHCVVSDGAKIDGCIISRHSRIGEKAELVKCQTQAGYEVAAEEKVKGEKLEANDWATGGLASEDEDDEDDEE